MRVKQSAPLLALTGGDNGRSLPLHKQAGTNPDWRAMRKRMALCAIWALFGVGPAVTGQPQHTAPHAQKFAQFEPHPAIWQVSDGDTTLYLFGTTHALPKHFAWQSPKLKQVVQTADELVVESLDTRDSKAKSDASIDDALNPVVDNNPILGRVALEKRAALQKAITRSGFPTQFYDAMPTWMASLVLAVETMTQDGRDKSEGVEARLIAAFQRSGRPIKAAEDGSLILRKMHALSADAQRRMLENTLDDIDGAGANSAAMDKAWVKGDVAALADGFTREALGEELYTLLILNRNNAWSDWIADRMHRPGTVLFAVGAGHFSGPDALPILLAQRGMRVTRID